MITLVASTETGFFFLIETISALKRTRIMIMTFNRRVLPVLLVFLVCAAIGCTAIFAQSDLPRKTVALACPLDESVTVKFRGTTLLPRLKGEAKVKREIG